MRTLALASFPAFLLLLLVPVACGGGGTTDATGGATPGSGGAVGSGGAPTGSGGVGSGGASPSGGAAATGGTATTGGQPGSGGSSNTGGSSSGGSSSGGSGNGSGGGSSAAVPSAGCEAGNGRPQGGLVTANNSHFFTFPEDYDGTTPMPVIFGFHGCSAGNRGDGSNPATTEYIKETNGTVFETDYVRAVPVSADSGGCWNYGNDISRAKAVFDELAEDHCIDLSRVFATGHSSGAQFIVQMLRSSNPADAEHFNFAGIAPVAASDYGPMDGPIPVMYIQGITDAERGGGDGHETVEQFVAANDCMSTSADYTPVMGCQSGNVSVDPGCIVHDGCTAPTIWCSHNDPEYNNTFHGIPCFASDAMADFFATLP